MQRRAKYAQPARKAVKGGGRKSAGTKSSSASVGGRGASRMGNQRNRGSNGNAKAKKTQKLDQPRSELDVYEDSDGEGQAAFYSHIDEEARPDLSSMDEATRRRFKTTTNEDYDDDGDDTNGDDFGDDDEEIDEDEAFDEEDEAKYGELLSRIGNKNTKSDNNSKKTKPNASKVTLSESESDKDEEEADEGSEVEDLEEDNEGDYKRLDEIFDDLDDQDGEEDNDQAGRRKQDTAAYAKMMAAVQGQKKPKKVYDPTTEQFYPEGEFNLQPSATKSMLTLETLMGSLKDEVQYGDVKKQLVQLQKTKNLLAQPLAQPAKEKLTREEAYTKKKLEITEKWETTVLENRKADHLKFPFAEAPAPRLTAASLANIQQPANDLEKGIADILAQSGVTKKDIEELEGLDPKELNPEELEERESQIQKMKAILFYEEMKAKRRKKIKSKAYHRILKKKKMKSALSLEELQQVDEEAAQKEAEKLERMRIQERITQRHKNKGKWAQRQLMRGHVDKETRQAISEQIRIRDQLLKKQLNLDDAEDADVDNMDDEELLQALEKLEQDETPQVEKGLMAMSFMKRGIKRRADEMRDAKEQWEQDLDEMIRQSRVDSEDEVENKPEEETEPQGRRTINKQHITQVTESGVVAPVKFSGATQQTERAALSSGRTVKMSGHATIDVPASLMKGAPSRKEPEIAQIFAVEEFPDTEDSEKQAPVHDLNKNKHEVDSILKDHHNEKEKKPKSKQRRKQAASSPKPTLPQAEAESHAEIEHGEHQASHPDRQAYLSIDRIRSPTSTKKKVPLTVQEESSEQPNDDLPDRPEKTVKATRRAPSKPEAEDKDNPWMKKSTAATGTVAKKTAPSAITASHASVEDKVAKTQKKTALNKRQKAETTLKLEVNKLISDVVATQTREHDDDRSASAGSSGASFNLLASASEEQKELIKRAFANDDVVEEFQADKQFEVEADLPKAPKPAVMPGWGEWVGEGVQQRKPKKKPRIQKPKRANELPAKPPTRSDDGLDHVIINQKRNKKAARFLADQLPALYRKQPELYEAQIQTPLGREWNTQHVYDSITRPRIELKRGQNIKPISKPMPKKKDDEDMGEPVNKPKTTRASGTKRKREPKGKK